MVDFVVYNLVACFQALFKVKDTVLNGIWFQKYLPPESIFTVFIL